MPPKKVTDGKKVAAVKGTAKGKGTAGDSPYKNGNERGFLKPKAHLPRSPKVSPCLSPSTFTYVLC